MLNNIIDFSSPSDKNDIDLGNVDNTSDEDKPISTATQAALDTKVNKVTGKGLSSNDFTNNDKNKLDGLNEDIYYKSLAQHNNSYTLNFRHANRESNKISINQAGNEFTFEEEGAYNIMFFAALKTTQSGKKIKLVAGGGMTTTNFLLYRLDTLSQMSLWEMEIPNTSDTWMKHNFMFPTLPLKAGAKIKIETENAGGSGFDGLANYEYFLITKIA